MSLSHTIVISCAGYGARLGLGKTKALVDILGRPLIHWQLDLVKDCSDVRVVVGYQAADVIDVVRAYRPDVTFVFNHEYASTATAASVSLASRYASGMIVALSGDTLIHPDDFKALLKAPHAVVGVTPIASEKPVYVQLNQDNVVGFDWEQGEAEWSGIMKLEAASIQEVEARGRGRGYVFEILQQYLPLPALPIRTTEVDTIRDYEQSCAWLLHYKDIWPQ
jgi:choline kinase